MSNSLENYIADKMGELDANARPTKASGSSTEILDIRNNIMFWECRQDLTRDNIIVNYEKDYLEPLNKTPVTIPKPFAIAKENKQGEKFVIMEAEEFFRILYKAYGGNNE